MIKLAEAPARQRNLFNKVITELEKLGYRGDLLAKEYPLCDWFVPGQPERIVSAAGFGQTPVSYDNACFAVVLSNGKSGTELIADYRALGAPQAFEVKEDCVLRWRVARTPTQQDLQEVIQVRDIGAAFDRNADYWRPESVLRARNITAPGPRQLDFIDLGLIPALEQHIREKLDPLLQKILHEAVEIHKESTGRDADYAELFRLLFRCIAGKIMRDWGLAGFIRMPDPPEPEVLLEKVTRHYGEQEPIIDDPATRQVIVERLWESVSFQNLSVEVLAFIWENTLVSKDLRREHGIHATPPSIARYIAHRLPIEDVPQDERRVVEPCCGSGTFLIAALQRLRELLPSSLDAKERHKYFTRMLSGFDIGTFDLEVARLCLMLADFPNPNSWVLEEENVFQDPDSSSRFHVALRNARIVLCNPPFEDFKSNDRQRLQPSSVHKPVELLSRVLDNLHAEGLLGFVLPRQLLNGNGYREVRQRLAERYSEFEIVSLPDKAFEHAEHETVLLLAKKPHARSPHVTVQHRKVCDAEWKVFAARYTATREDSDTKRNEECAENLGIVDLQEIWRRLAGFARIRDITAELGRGIEWNIPLTRKDNEGKQIRVLENQARLMSEKNRRGFKRGIMSAPRNLWSYQCPRVSYLCCRKEYRRGKKPWELPWHKPKVVMNAKRKSRGPWRIAAFADHSGLVCYQTFTCLWPRETWSVNVLAAVLNGPLANAYVATREGNRDITKEVLEDIPLPRLSFAQRQDVEARVASYVDAVNDVESNIFTSPQRAERILREIDAVVLRAYSLPPRLERELLDYFQGEGGKRPVPFDFGDYYPSDFQPYIPLWMYDSEEFQRCSAENFLDNAPRITDPAVLAALMDVE